MKQLVGATACIIVVIFACAIVAASEGVSRSQPFNECLYALGSRLAPHLPEGRLLPLPAGRWQSMESPHSAGKIVVAGVALSEAGLIWYLVEERLVGGTMKWSLYHMLVCALVLLCYRFRGFPEAIRPCIGGRRVAWAHYTRVAALSALLSVVWLPLALVLYRVFWGAYMRIPVFVVGPVGAWWMFSGAILAHLAVVVWAVRRQIRRAVRGLPDIYCTKCGYELTRAAGSTCPECGSREAPRRPLSTFGLSRLSVRLQCTAWRYAFVPAVVLVTFSLCMAPVLLPLIGRILPTPVLEFIGRVYYTLF